AHTVAQALPPPDAVPKPMVMSGHAADLDGTPVPGARLVLTSPQYLFNPVSAPLPSWASLGVADGDGFYQFAIFAPASSVVLGASTRDNALLGIRTNLVVVPGEKQEVDIEM